MWLFRLFFFLLLSLPAFAQDWPARLVKFVSPYPPGGSVDPLARILAAKLAESLKQQFIVENRTGASGIIGTDYVAKRSEEHTSELQSHSDLVCRLLLEKKKNDNTRTSNSTHPSGSHSRNHAA